VLASGGSRGALLVSPFNIKWRCYAQAGGVEESKFYLFWLVFPVRCISSISPRIYFRRHTFCFLPLAAILEFLCRLTVLNSWWWIHGHLKNYWHTSDLFKFSKYKKRAMENVM
jgi:hypothetical protein